jgi:hypothetical protein
VVGGQALRRGFQSDPVRQAIVREETREWTRSAIAEGLDQVTWTYAAQSPGLDTIMACPGCLAICGGIRGRVNFKRPCAPNQVHSVAMDGNVLRSCTGEQSWLGRCLNVGKFDLGSLTTLAGSTVGIGPAELRPSFREFPC